MVGYIELLLLCYGLLRLREVLSEEAIVEKLLENVLAVESPCGIEPQSLINENLTIRL